MRKPDQTPPNLDTGPPLDHTVISYSDAPKLAPVEDDQNAAALMKLRIPTQSGH